MRKILYLGLIIVPLLFFLTSQQKNFVHVDKVVDGDTFVSEGKYYRLLGIDAPEKGQKCYEEAKNELKNLIENKTVRIEFDENKKDKYGRYLVYVFLNETFVNREMVKNGYAVFRDYGEKLKYEKELNMRPVGCVASIDSCDECIGVSYILWNPKGDDCKGGEILKLKNFCDFSCNISGWILENSRERLLVFENVILNETLYVISDCKKSESNKIYICKKGCKAIWSNKGDSVILRNSRGKIVLNYTYKGVR